MGREAPLVPGVHEEAGGRSGATVDVIVRGEAQIEGTDTNVRRVTNGLELSVDCRGEADPREGQRIAVTGVARREVVHLEVERDVRPWADDQVAACESKTVSDLVAEAERMDLALRGRSSAGDKGSGEDRGARKNDGSSKRLRCHGVVSFDGDLTVP